MRYGVIDVGSNGIRMLMVEVRDSGFEVLERRREPVRLGQDVYRHGSIGRELLDQVVAAFQGFRQDFDRAGMTVDRLSRSFSTQADYKIALADKIENGD